VAKVSRMLTGEALKIALAITENRVDYMKRGRALEEAFEEAAKALAKQAQAAEKALWGRLYGAAEVSPEETFELNFEHFDDCGHAYIVQEDEDQDEDALSDLLGMFANHSNETIN